ncbi:MAG: META domain-containing protein [Polyangiaceae bacterium]|nr:META domain-containing protein [Polyangiaceae bacterium]
MKSTITTALSSLTLLFLTTALTTACSGDDPDPDAETKFLLQNRTFYLHHADGFTPMRNTKLSLGFWKSEMYYRAGCNWMSGDFDIRNDILIAAEQFSTLMYCETAQGSIIDQEDWYADFLDSKPSIRIDGDYLALASDLVTMYYYDSVLDEPNAPLTNQVWSIQTCATNPPRYPQQSYKNRPWFKVSEDGKVSTFDGCNTGEGTFDVSYAKPTFGTIRFGSFTYTNTDCPEPIPYTPGSEPDNCFEPIFSGNTDFRIVENTLVIGPDYETATYATAD